MSRPPQDSSHARGTALALVGVGCVLLLWQVATALPGPGAHGEVSSATGTSGFQGGHTHGRTVLPVTLHPPPAPLPPAHALEPVASFAESAPAPAIQAMSRPPAAPKELAPDGLPASAMHCTFDGGVMTCGSCRTDSDCPAGQGCVANRETRRLECMASECEEDAHCLPGFACRAANRGDSGPVVRRCTPEGIRREGETCDSGYLSRGGACREGLRCVSELCTVPCRLEDPVSCPTGYLCREGADGPGCVPDCQQLGCPQGQQCKRITESRYQCLESVVGTCPETPCAEGERCVKRVVRGRGVFWCARSCNPLLPNGCPAGYVCGQASRTTSACFPQCDPHDLDSCDEGWRCGTVSEDMTLWGCNLAPHP